MTQEFHISVTPMGQDDYLVRTEQVSPGVPFAEELVTWPVEDWLTQAAGLMNDHAVSEPQKLNLVTLGQQLYSALFQGSLRDSWTCAQGIAQRGQEVLRLRLELKETPLARLPWEVLHAGDRPLATEPYVAFSRYQAGTTPRSKGRTLTIGMPSPSLQQGVVKVLMVLTAPSEQVSLALKQEATKLQAELCQSDHREAACHGTTELQITLLEQPGREQLTQALEQGQYQVLHYAGRGNLDSSGEELYLVSGKTGLTETLSGDDLAGLLVNNGIQMAVFKSGLGAYTATFDPTADPAVKLTQSLVKRGIRSVLAMAECIPDAVALTLTRQFYRNLSQGYPVDLSLSRVRQELFSAYGFDQLYWALPILYLQPECDGYLTTSETSFPQPAGLLNDSALGLTATPVAYSVGSYTWDTPSQISEMTASGFLDPAAELDLLDEEDWEEGVDEIDYDDPAYKEDSAVVSDLFRQLTNPTPAAQEHPSSPSPPAPPAPPAPLLPISPSPPLSYKSCINKAKWYSRTWVVSGVVGVAAIALLGLWFQNREPPPEYFLPPIPQSSLPKPADVNLKTASTSDLSAIAIEHFNKGNLSAGCLAVEELLNRGALQNAIAALAAVSELQAETSAISFLRGRLAWQSVQVGDKNYSLDTARRYWETAVKDKPDSPVYHNALGFAYYAQGNLNRANQAWFQALYLLEQQQAKKTSGSTTPAPTKAVANRDALNAYAGLALVLSKSAQNQPADKQAKLLSEAIKLRQKVLTDDPVNFQPQTLGKNWLWTQKAIQDWRSLLKQ